MSEIPIFIDGETPISAPIFNGFRDYLHGVRDETLAARDEAIEAAEQAGAPADDVIAGLVASPTSGTRGQLDARYATTAAVTELTDAVDEVAGTALTIEDAFTTVSLQTSSGAWSNTADVSAPIFAAPYPMLVRSLALVTWSGGAISTSDTAYWRAVLRKAPAGGGAAVDIAYKTTRVTASGGTPNYPAGSTWTPRIAWTFDTAQFGAAAALNAGDILYLATLPVGTPGAIAGAIIATIGYQPL